MQRINAGTLRELVGHEADAFVSLYAPLHPGLPEQRQDPIRLKNLLTQAHAELAKATSSRKAKRVLAPLADQQKVLLSNANGFRGLACFAAEDFLRAYYVPEAVDEACFVGDRFSIAPLLPLLHYDGRFFVLALSRNEARLYEMTRRSIAEWDLPPIERPDDDAEQSLQHHSHKAPTQGKVGVGETMYHGQGGGPSDKDKGELLAYCQAVDRSVCQALAGQSAPLVLACVEYLAPVYASANGYSHLVVGCVSGNYDRARLDELRDDAWRFVEPHFEQICRDAVAGFEQAVGSERAETDPRRAAEAAGAGRIATLLVSRSAVERASSNGRDGAATDESCKLVEEAAAQTLRHGGDVVAIEEMPTDASPLAAVLRF